ncbi:MAG: hemin uptake protein HemP [Pirellulales bacterium]
MADEREREPPQPRPAEQEPAKPPRPIRLLRTVDLFQGGDLVLIEHEGAIYKLRITSRGRLILQK